MRGAVRIVASVFAIPALAEAIFAIYYYHLIRRAQVQPPTTGLSPKDRNAFFRKVLSLDPCLSASIPEPNRSAVSPVVKPRQRRSAFSELQIKIDKARIKDATLPSMDEVVMTATADNMLDSTEQVPVAGSEPAMKGFGGGLLKDENRAVELRERLRPW